MFLFGVRLKEERERLEKQQKDFAEIIGVTAKTQRNYEQGLRKPDAEYLEKASEVGVDVQYVITGKRAIPDRRLEAFVGIFEGLSEQQQQEILGSIQEKKLLNELLKQKQDKVAS